MVAECRLPWSEWTTSSYGLPERVPERPTLEAHCHAWQQARNLLGAPTNWQFTTEKARIKLKRLYPTIN